MCLINDVWVVSKGQLLVLARNQGNIKQLGEFTTKKKKKKMDDSGAILCQLSALKDMLDQVRFVFSSVNFIIN